MQRSRKKIIIPHSFPHSPRREEFYLLPRAESLIKKDPSHAPRHLGALVINQSTESTERSSLPVEDNRMADAGIRSGDHVIIEQKRHYNDGEVVAVRIGTQVFIRRYFCQAGRVRLECNTPERQTMILEAGTPGFTIMGVVVQVIKEL